MTKAKSKLAVAAEMTEADALAMVRPALRELEPRQLARLHCELLLRLLEQQGAPVSPRRTGPTGPTERE